MTARTAALVLQARNVTARRRATTRAACIEPRRGAHRSPSSAPAQAASTSSRPWSRSDGAVDRRPRGVRARQRPLPRAARRLAGNQTLSIVAEMLNEIVARAVTAVSQARPRRRLARHPPARDPLAGTAHRAHRHRRQHRRRGALAHPHGRRRQGHARPGGEVGHRPPRPLLKWREHDERPTGRPASRRSTATTRASQPLIGPGGTFEVEETVLDGVPLRVFVRAPRTIVDTFAMGAAHADLVHLVHEDERLDLRRGARAARSRSPSSCAPTFGVGRGDRVAIAMRNLPEFVIGFWGAALLGAIVVPLNSWWTGAELTTRCENAGATVAFARRRAARSGSSTDGRPDGARLVGVRTDARRRRARSTTWCAARRSPTTPIARLEPDDPVDHPLHVGHDRPAEGRARHQPRPRAQPLEHGVRRRARGDHHRTRARARPPAGHARRPQPMFHIGGIAAIIGSPMGGSQDPDHAQVGPRRRALRLAVDERPHRVRRRARRSPARSSSTRASSELDLDVRGFPMGGAAVPPDLPVKARRGASASRSSSSTATASPRPRRRS